MPIQVDGTRHQRTLTFSLKSLMFLTFVVSICAALIGASAVLAVLFLPFIIAALVRTVRVCGRIATIEQQPSGRRGLFATFCRSLALVMSLVVVSAMAFLIACCAGFLIALGVIGRLCQPFVAILRRCATRVWPLVLRAWNNIVVLASRMKPGPIFFWVRDLTVNGTVLLLSASRILIRRCWYPEIADRVAPAVST